MNLKKPFLSVSVSVSVIASVAVLDVTELKIHICCQLQEIPAESSIFHTEVYRLIPTWVMILKYIRKLIPFITVPFKSMSAKAFSDIVTVVGVSVNISYGCIHPDRVRRERTPERVQ